MSRGIVYILTNPCLDGWVKIGMSARNDVDKRVAELNAPPNMPLSFRAYAVYHVENPREVESDIHELIDMVDGSLHARETMSSGRVRQREFFRISPEKAYSIFKKVAKFRGDLDQLEFLSTTKDQQEEEEIAPTRRKPFSFGMLGIPVGAELSFIKDDSVICKVLDEKNHVEYNGERTTLSSIVESILGGSYQGPYFFTFDGETLTDRRARLEAEQAVEDD